MSWLIRNHVMEELWKVKAQWYQDGVESLNIYAIFSLPANCRYTGSSGDVSGWIWSLPSQRAAEDFDGSAWAGSESDPV